ncbi:TetR/AcrR family transcriptional regulator [Streptosporangium sp. NPDC020145]|uniref:TetR/AcrR family transcriptional regulator n=1 Tax=Streptosporangium sp. NPDC020145 TaxID=3154694 RepID=UPI0034460DA3
MTTNRDGRAPLGDRRVRRTQKALQGALIELVEERDLSRLSVADVAGRAGVSRSTFYDHYRDVHELAEAACTVMIDELIGAVPGPGAVSADPARDAPQKLLAFFTTLAEHAGLYRALLGPSGSARVIDHIRRRATAAGYAGARQARGRATVEGTGEGTGEVTVEGAGEAVRQGDGDPHDVPAAFAAGALVGVAADWLQRGCPRTPAEMADLTWPLFTALYRRD